MRVFHYWILWFVVGMTSLGGIVHYWLDDMPLAAGLWGIAALPATLWVLWDIVSGLRKGNVGVDLIAALALVGALLLGEFLVAAIISLMYVGGQVLEKYAANRAQRELTALLNRVPSRAEIYRGDGLQSVPVEQVKPGDRLLIKSGMVLPVDGYVAAGKAILDESSLTGESLPVTFENGQAASSGTLNVGAPFDLIAVHDAANSRYSEVIRLVKEAQEGKSSFTRMADRYALWFVPLTLLIAGIAWWYSADPVRALSVLVVATPCPLILAAPIAIVSGISAAAKRGLLLKNGAVLEVLSKVERIILDKTGTLTTGHPRLVEIETDGELSREEVLRLAASLEQLSFHSVSHSIVEEAKQRGLMLAMPLEVEEVAGSGIKGIVNQQAVMVGQPEWVLAGMNPSDWVRKLMERSHNQGIMLILLALDKDVRGVLLLQDEIRFDSPRTLRSLRSAGAESLAMASGDQVEIAESIGYALGMDKVYGGLRPEDKVEVVKQERRNGVTLMVGDGINDAPALAVADVGVAIGSGGSGASSQAADAVLMEDRLGALADGLRIARRSQLIARQSVIVGMSLSAVAMLFAALGHLPPVNGAILQEVIDVAVILNALRALRVPVEHHPVLNPEEHAALQGEHTSLKPILEQIREVADVLALEQPVDMSRLMALSRVVQQELIPHEQEDERRLHPALAHRMPGNDPMAMLSRTHAEIMRLCRQYQNQLQRLQGREPDLQERRFLLKTLYSLSAILELHFAQEDELYALLATNQLG